MANALMAAVYANAQSDWRGAFPDKTLSAIASRRHGKYEMSHAHAVTIVIWHTHTCGLLITRLLQLFVIRNIHHAVRSYERGSRAWVQIRNRATMANNKSEWRIIRFAPRTRNSSLGRSRSRCVCIRVLSCSAVYFNYHCCWYWCCPRSNGGAPPRPITFRPQLRGDSQSIFMASTFVLTYIISSISHYCDCWLSDQLPPRAADRLTRSYLIHFLSGIEAPSEILKGVPRKILSKHLFIDLAFYKKMKQV